MKSVLTRIAGLALVWFCVSGLRAETFRVATYNVESYLDQPTESRRAVKSDAAKAKIRESIHALKPDVLALEEMGTTNALLELRASLKAEGLDYPYWEHVQSFDTNIHLAVLSRLPIIARRPHTNENFLLDGRRFHVGRGFAEVDIRVTEQFAFTLFVAHLKSRRTALEADESDLRLQEARCLRAFVDARLTQNPQAKLVVLGDFNDLKNSAAVKEIMGRGRFKLTDTRPAEANGDTAPSASARFDPRKVTWTNYYGVEDSYSRVDYILISPAMNRCWVPAETVIATVPNWGVGSDHRPIAAAFDPGKL